MEAIMRFLRALCLLIGTILLSGCFLTKLVTVPMRVVGAVTSIVPVAGDVAHGTIDEAADAVDKLPF
jgi:Family of unknown function (DUF6726)